MTARWPCRAPRNRLLAARNGAAAAEFAIILPGFFALLLGIFEIARACFAANSLQFAVAQGARYAMTSPSASGKPTGANCTGWSPTAFQSSVKTYLQTQLSNAYLSAAAPSVSASCTASSSTSPSTLTVTVKASYTFDFWLSKNLLGVFASGIAMQQQATITAPLS